ncbi:hypothetical protein ABL78_3223 [Leptomonas seymouri]|uniref:EXPERA domain-containing protein n=1 Tax=Leptomonas seymouri TaxID=5684 RepID=A0A0N1I830_LEPSE|nr:hypothetical protein ABL78_3223 [Leptomonas seymouri]|eukprot:KPI87685.1 hypothetical protein ABL78_3223 [Leptomonas seymouri]
MPQAGLPLLAAVWFCAVAPVVLVDGIFVLTRSVDATVAHPLSDVFPFNYWTLYSKYDLRYAPNDDAFVVAQSWLNVVEVVLGLLAVMLSLCRAKNAAVKLGLLVATMTMYKTVLYFAMDIAEGSKFTKHNTLFDLLSMVVIPSSWWIIIPAIIIKKCFNILALTNGQERKGRANKSNEERQKNAVVAPPTNQPPQQTKKKK